MRMWWRTFVIATTLVAASGPQPTITAEQAKQIVSRNVFENDAKIALTQYGSDFGFYFFEASWDNPHGSMIAGHFAVNRRTATLWDMQGSVCNVLTSDQLRKFQQGLRGRLSVDRRTLARLSSSHPAECSIIGRTREAKAS
jgi:hypothetical protein